MALEVIREIKEEPEEPGADDDIVLLCSPAADQQQKTVNDSNHAVRMAFYDKWLNTQLFFLNYTNRNGKMMGKSSLLRRCLTTTM